MRVGLALSVVVALASSARSQPSAAPADETEASGRDAGFIGQTIPRLEIEDCPAVDPSLTQDQLRRRAAEHYQRGETLYIQGDYDGAVHELIAAYCLIPYYRVLKDIGQAFERTFEYEKAIGYLTRYIDSVPPDAKRENACASDPQDDKTTVSHRITVLQRLKAKIYVETTPNDAHITIGNVGGIAARATSRQEIRVHGGRYEMLVERDGYESKTIPIEVRIGKPYTYYVQLAPNTGTLSVQVTPAEARIFVDDRAVGIGRYEEAMPSGTYTLTFEAPGYQLAHRKVEVLSKETRRELVELAPEPQTGRRQFVIGTGIAGGLAVGGLLSPFDEPTVQTAGFVLGGAASLVGAYFWAPSDLPLGTANLSITSGLAGTVAGFAASYLFSDKNAVTQSMTSAGLVVGGTAGYLAGRRFDVSPGDAALFNSSVVWGTTTGLLLSLSFDPPQSVSSGLVLSGLGMGTVGGALLANYFDISRRHAVLIDIGGIIGMVSGVALKGVIYPDAESANNTERLSNFALGGLAIGLVGAGILTRNLDAPKLSTRSLPVPALGTATGSDGKTTTTFGIVGTF